MCINTNCTWDTKQTYAHLLTRQTLPQKRRPRHTYTLHTRNKSNPKHPDAQFGIFVPPDEKRTHTDYTTGIPNFSVSFIATAKPRLGRLSKRPETTASKRNYNERCDRRQRHCVGFFVCSLPHLLPTVFAST
ncbi:unnamed protein product [Ixodes pacificus]